AVRRLEDELIVTGFVGDDRPAPVDGKLVGPGAETFRVGTGIAESEIHLPIKAFKRLHLAFRPSPPWTVIAAQPTLVAERRVTAGERADEVGDRVDVLAIR